MLPPSNPDSSSSPATCASSYPQAATALSNVTQLLAQAVAIYATDHANGLVSDAAYQAGNNALLGISLDASAAHDMVQIGGDAPDITAQITTVQGELATVLNPDLLVLVAQMQASLTSASALVVSSASCPASVSQ